MRFMIIVKSDDRAEAGAMPDARTISEMATFHEALANAGVLVDASGLQPSAKGLRIRYAAGGRALVDGPFAETKELVAGYTIIRVDSRAEAVRWAMRFPNPQGEGADCEIEVRQLFELEDFEPSEGIERFRRLDAGRT